VTLRQGDDRRYVLGVFTFVRVVEWGAEEIESIFPSPT
jgi:hypothetical protein